MKKCFKGILQIVVSLVYDSELIQRFLPTDCVIPHPMIQCIFPLSDFIWVGQGRGSESAKKEE
jgi:hypothetical protein